MTNLSTRIRLLGALSLASLHLTSASCGMNTLPEAWSDGELARYDHQILTIEDLDRHLRSLPADQRQPSVDIPLQPWLEERLFEVFSSRVLPTLERAEELRRRPQFEQSLTDATETALAKAFLQVNSSNFEISPEDVAREFERLRPTLQSPEHRTFRSLFLSFGQAGNAADKKASCERGRLLAEEARTGASFDALVREHSDSSNAHMGGLVGPVDQGALRGEAGRVVFSMEPGEISDPLRTSSGCFVFYLQQVIPAIEPDLKLLQRDIAQQLAARKRTEWRATLLEETIQSSQLSVPQWVLDSTREPRTEADQTIVQTSRRVLRGRDIAAQLTQGAKGVAAVRQRVANAVFAEAFAQQNPLRTEKIETQITSSALGQLVQNDLLREALDGIPGDELQRLFENHRDELLTEPRLELRLFSWPVFDSDRKSLLQRPQSFVSAVQASVPIDQAWEQYGKGGRISSLPETTLRKMQASRPGLRELLSFELAEGRWLGPSHVDDEVVVARVERFLQHRQLAFVEANNRLRAIWMQENREQLLGTMRSDLKREHSLVFRQVPQTSVGELLQQLPPALNIPVAISNDSH